MSSNAPSPVVVAPDGGTALTVVGDVLTFKLGAAQTGGKFCVAVGEIKPGGGPPPHAHRNEDEMFYILEGTFEFLLGDRTEVHGPGTTVFVPKGNLHTFRNVGNTTGKFVSLHTPGGFEAFFEEAGIEATDIGTSPPAAPLPDAGTLLGLLAKHGMESPKAPVA